MTKARFDATAEEMAIIMDIVQRWFSDKPHDADKELSLAMDLDATHSNGCPLDFDKLLAFDDGNFSHDVGQIMRFIDRTNGQLQNCFVPRCAKPTP